MLSNVMSLIDISKFLTIKTVKKLRKKYINFDENNNKTQNIATCPKFSKQMMKRFIEVGCDVDFSFCAKMQDVAIAKVIKGR